VLINNSSFSEDIENQASNEKGGKVGRIEDQIKEE